MAVDNVAGFGRIRAFLLREGQLVSLSLNVAVVVDEPAMLLVGPFLCAGYFADVVVLADGCLLVS